MIRRLRDDIPSARLYQHFCLFANLDEVFKERSMKLERIDTGDYTAKEYDRFLSDIRKVNRYAGDNRALRKTLLSRIDSEHADGFSVLDVGAGSGELLRTVARFARKRGKNACLTGLELNSRSAESILEESPAYPEITAVRGDALCLPFASSSFDFVISSLFAHHLTDSQITGALREMSRVAKRGVYLIDLHRHPFAYLAYKAFCTAFQISPLVRQDGSLSILRAFRSDELTRYAAGAGLKDFSVVRSFPFRLVLSGR
jgi:ubiquinone/menaquinone biosynthesis C-methylase UbiE